MSNTAKILISIETILVLIFISLIGAVTLNYLAYDQIKYVIYLILILVPMLTVSILKLKEEKQISEKSRKILIWFSIITGIILIVWTYIQFN